MIVGSGGSSDSHGFGMWIDPAMTFGVWSHVFGCPVHEGLGAGRCCGIEPPNPVGLGWGCAWQHWAAFGVSQWTQTQFKWSQLSNSREVSARQSGSQSVSQPGNQLVSQSGQSVSQSSQSWPGDDVWGKLLMSRWCGMGPGAICQARFRWVVSNEFVVLWS